MPLGSCSVCIASTLCVRPCPVLEPMLSSARQPRRVTRAWRARRQHRRESPHLPPSSIAPPLSASHQSRRSPLACCLSWPSLPKLPKLVSLRRPPPTNAFPEMASLRRLCPAMSHNRAAESQPLLQSFSMLPLLQVRSLVTLKVVRAGIERCLCWAGSSCQQAANRGGSQRHPIVRERRLAYLDTARVPMHHPPQNDGLGKLPLAVLAQTLGLTKCRTC